MNPAVVPFETKFNPVKAPKILTLATLVCPESTPAVHVPPVPQSVKSPPVVAPLIFTVVWPVEVPGEVMPSVTDVLLFVELVFWNTQGAVRFAVDTPARVT